MTRMEENVALTQSMGEWLRRLALEGELAAEVAVDVADILAAAEAVKELSLSMMKADPSVPREADAALTAAAEIEVQLFTELKSHLETLERAWPRLLERLDALSEEAPA